MSTTMTRPRLPDELSSLSMPQLLSRVIEVSHTTNELKVRYRELMCEKFLDCVSNSLHAVRAGRTKQGQSSIAESDEKGYFSNVSTCLVEYARILAFQKNIASIETLSRLPTELARRDYSLGECMHLLVQLRASIFTPDRILRYHLVEQSWTASRRVVLERIAVEGLSGTDLECSLDFPSQDPELGRLREKWIEGCIAKCTALIADEGVARSDWLSVLRKWSAKRLCTDEMMRVIQTAACVRMEGTDSDADFVQDLVNIVAESEGSSAKNTESLAALHESLMLASFERRFVNAARDFVREPHSADPVAIHTSCCRVIFDCHRIDESDSLVFKKSMFSFVLGFYEQVLKSAPASLCEQVKTKNSISRTLNSLADIFEWDNEFANMNIDFFPCIN